MEKKLCHYYQSMLSPSAQVSKWATPSCFFTTRWKSHSPDILCFSLVERAADLHLNRWDYHSLQETAHRFHKHLTSNTWPEPIWHTPHKTSLSRPRMTRTHTSLTEHLRDALISRAQKQWRVLNASFSRTSMRTNLWQDFKVFMRNMNLWSRTHYCKHLLNARAGSPYLSS